MGIASWALGDDNPFAKYVADNKNLVHGAFAGLGQGKTFGQGLGSAALYAQQGGLMDDVARKDRNAEAEAAALKEKYASWFTQQGQPQIAQGIADGIIEPGQAYWDFITPKPAGDAFTLGAGQSRYDAAGNLIAQGAPDQPSYPASYQEHLLAQQDPSYAAAQAQSDAPMNSTIQKELFEAEDAVAAGGYVMSALDSAINLNKSAADGAWAGQRATIGANIPDIGIFNGDQTDQSTIQYQNIVNELALNQLKTIFGAAPTEGERKILLEIQGSVEQPRAVREQILQRAKQMAERRIAEAQAKAAGLRSGQYFQPGYGGGQPPAADGWQDMGNGVRIRPLGQ
jgi:hypothetical protein